MKSLVESIQKLPPELQHEVEDFVQFLLGKCRQKTKGTLKEKDILSLFKWERKVLTLYIANGF